MKAYVFVNAVPGKPADVALQLRRISGIKAADMCWGVPSLLAAWLNELLFHAEAEWWVPMDFADVRASDTEIRARVRGAVVTEPPAPVNAAMPSAVRLRDVAGWLEARVTLMRGAQS